MREFIELVEDDGRIFIPLELDDHADAFAVGFVPQIGNTGNLFIAHQFGYFFDQRSLVDLIGQFCKDDGFSIVAGVLFNKRSRPDADDAASSFIGGKNSFPAIDKSGGGKIRTRNMTHKLFNGNIRILNAGDSAVDNFLQIMGWNIGCHTDSDAGGSIEQ